MGTQIIRLGGRHVYPLSHLDDPRLNSQEEKRSVCGWMMDGWVAVWMSGWLAGWLGGWLGGWVDRFVNGWVGGWLYG